MSFDYDDLTSEIVRDLENIKTDDTAAVIPVEAKEKVRIIADNNLLNAGVSNVYLTPIANSADEILSAPISTTTTLSGVLENLKLDEHQVDLFVPNERVIMIESNFGCRVHDSIKHKLDAIAPKTKRGRKPKTKKIKKERKKQGSGKCFNSQITFIVTAPPHKDPKSLSGFREYKFKVFRNNKEQLPGARPEYLDAILEANKHVIDLLNSTLIKDGMPQIYLKNLSASMKNYKFFLKLEQNQIINLMLLKKIFLIERLKDVSRGQQLISEIRKINCSCGEKKCINCFNKGLLDDDEIRIICDIDDNSSPPHPPISDVIYTTEDTKLSIKFSTPTDEKPGKKVRVNIFPGSMIATEYADGIEENTYGGKINILGALHENTTKLIYYYLISIFERYYDDIIVNIGLTGNTMYEILDSDSDDESDDEADELPGKNKVYVIDAPKPIADNIKSIVPDTKPTPVIDDALAIKIYNELLALSK